MRYIIKRKQPFLIALCMSFQSVSVSAQTSNMIYNADKYILYKDSIVQAQFVAKAISDKEIVSNYKSPANEFQSAEIVFKFSINGRDNEMASGVDHHFILDRDSATTPIIKFGQQLKAGKTTNSFLKPGSSMRIRLDMREVLNAFKTQGYYTTFKGDKIYQSDFKGVFVAGSTTPLTWDFDNLGTYRHLRLNDDDGDGIYEITLNMNSAEDSKETASQWKLSKDISSFPAYTSDFLISDALYNLAIEEMINAVEPDSTFRTGKEWAGVWTRDISYSIILSMAHLQPRVAKNSLMRKVNKKKKIIQDTGTGGAWPVSTDRMIWAVAAYELYKVTGDKDWLQQAYIIIKNSIDADLQTIYDKETSLAKGESSFLDWREQTYPKWMQPVDIAESECLGTNAVHYQANVVLSKMASALNHKAEAVKYLQVANKIKQGINTYLWQPAQYYYGQYLYGRIHKILSPRSEALGEALTVIFDIADTVRQKQIVNNTPVTDFGISCIFPQIPGIAPYHNNGVWPFVQTFWLWASAKAGNERSVMESIAAIYRPAALFATNKENFVAENGDHAGTVINSSNMLWSLSGSISIVHKVLFGIRFNENNLSFEPFVPKQLAGIRSLKNFIYRSAILDIELEGHGNVIKQFTLDGKITPRAEFNANMTGRHTIKIILDTNRIDEESINKVTNYTAPLTPEVFYDNGFLTWHAIGENTTYRVLKNGKEIITTKDLSIPVIKGTYSEYQVIAMDNKGIESFASEPVTIVENKFLQLYEIEQYAPLADNPYKGFSGKGFVELNLTKNKTVTIPVNITESGIYNIDFRYANGNGPINTENKCALRTLKIDGKSAGAALFPQRGKNEWNDWGYSNSNKVMLSKGKHSIILQYEQSNDNMNEVINQAMLDHMRVTLLKK